MPPDRRAPRSSHIQSPTDFPDVINGLTIEKRIRGGRVNNTYAHTELPHVIAGDASRLSALPTDEPLIVSAQEHK